MSDCKFDSLIINGKADSNTDSKSIFESYLESQAQLERLPKKLKQDNNLVQLNLFKEVHFQKVVTYYSGNQTLQTMLWLTFG